MRYYEINHAMRQWKCRSNWPRVCISTVPYYI